MRAELGPNTPHQTSLELASTDVPSFRASGRVVEVASNAGAVISVEPDNFDGSSIRVGPTVRVTTLMGPPVRAGSFPQTLSQRWLQSELTHSALQMPSVTQDPQPYP
jgi:hypothetical protein